MAQLPPARLGRGVRIALILIPSLILLQVIRRCQSEESSQQASTYTELTGEIFHTYYRIKYDSPIDHSVAVDSTFKAFSHSLNPFDSTSLITAINRNLSTHTDSMLRHVWRASVDIARASGGRYDVTCSPLINAWGFGFDSLRTGLTPAILDSLRGFVGYRSVSLVGEELIKQDQRTIFDFSSISKGYCSDLVGQTLRAHGANNYMVELGGEIAFRGTNPKGEPWRIGINKPIDDETGLLNDLEVIVRLDRPEGGLATSGNYRNYRVVEGKKVAHTINPLTGYPVQTDVLSATILAPSCMMADGLATACMTMTSAEVPALIAQFPGVEYLLILGGEGDKSFRTVMSEGFRKLIVSPE